MLLKVEVECALSDVDCGRADGLHRTISGGIDHWNNSETNGCWLNKL